MSTLTIPHFEFYLIVLLSFQDGDISLEVSCMHLHCMFTAQWVKKEKKKKKQSIRPLNTQKVKHFFFCSYWKLETEISNTEKPVVHIPACPNGEEGFMVKSLFSSSKACVREHVHSLWWTSLQHKNWGGGMKNMKMEKLNTHVFVKYWHQIKIVFFFDDDDDNDGDPTQCTWCN